MLKIRRNRSHSHSKMLRYRPAVLAVVLFSHTSFYIHRPDRLACVRRRFEFKYCIPALQRGSPTHSHLRVAAVHYLPSLRNEPTCVLVRSWCLRLHMLSLDCF